MGSFRGKKYGNKKEQLSKNHFSGSRFGHFGKMHVISVPLPGSLFSSIEP